MHHAMFDDVIRRSNRFFGRYFVPNLMQEGNVVRAVVPNRRSARRDGLFESANRRQLLVFDLDQLGGILCLVERFGDHERHRVSDVAYALARQQRLRRTEHGRAIAALACQMGPLQAEREQFGITAAEDQQHSGRQLRGLRVDRAECAHAHGENEVYRRAPAR